MSDLISRQDAIDSFDGTKVSEEYCTEYDIGYNDGINFAISKISVFPSADRPTGWIPVSERLPETIGEYLITVLSKPSRNAIVSAGYWNERLKEFGTFRSDSTWEKWDVVAWMPLPEPYKGGDLE